MNVSSVQIQQTQVRKQLREDPCKKTYASVRRDPKRHYPQAAEFYFQGHRSTLSHSRLCSSRGCPLSRGCNKDGDTVSVVLVIPTWQRPGLDKRMEKTFGGGEREGTCFVVYINLEPPTLLPPRGLEYQHDHHAQLAKALKKQIKNISIL